MYIKPESKLLSMSINENIASSTSPKYFFLENVNNGMYVNTTVPVDAYTNLELYSMMFAGDAAAAPLADCLVNN